MSDPLASLRAPRFLENPYRIWVYVTGFDVSLTKLDDLSSVPVAVLYGVAIG